MEEKKRRKQIAKISIFITSIFVIFISISYAFITKTLTGTKKQVINAGVLDLVLEEENEITISDALPMYDEVGMMQEDVFEFRLVNKTSNPTNYVLKLEEIETGTLDKSIVKYGLIKEGETTIDYVSNITNGVFDEGTIAGNDTIDYELRLWIDSEVTEIPKIQNKFLTFRLTADVNQEIKNPTGPVTNIAFDESIVGENCKTYNDGVDTFLVGQCSNNYVWYSGKLWRVVLKNNETGAVKMVTDNAITAITYNASGNTVFENSYMDQWLNQEFLPTLHNYEDYIVTTSVWDTSLDSTNAPIRPSNTTKAIRPVGLLNAYEFYTTYNKSDNLATNVTGYLNNKTHWWLITPHDPSKIKFVGYTVALLLNDESSVIFGVRPSINLKSTISISEGAGTLTDPYILEGDLLEPANGTTLLSTRYSGEYITFNNELYRIVNVENGLTKITAVDKPSVLSSNSFDNDSINFANASIKTDLENYYQGLKTTNKVAYNMIEPNTKWYLGALADGVNYKASICAIVDSSVSMNDCTSKAPSTTASIALSRVGEMFTSQITRRTKTYFWTLTPYDESALEISGANGIHTPKPVATGGARPSMYLKTNVVIASNNTGNGTYEKPYSIELGS